MSNCTLSKNKKYAVDKINFNPKENSYQLFLSHSSSSCPKGIFVSKKLELKINPDIATPYLHFNVQDGKPELVLKSMSLVNQNSSELSSSTETTSSLIPHESKPITASSTSHFTFLYILLGIILIALVIRHFLSKKQANRPYYPHQQPQPFDPNAPYNTPPPYQNPNAPFSTNNNPYQAQNTYGPGYGQPGQGPSKTGAFVSGLAGGALGYVAGKALYDQFSNKGDAQGQQNSSNEGTFSDDESTDSGDFSSDE